MLQLCNVSFDYQEVPLLKCVNFSLAKGELMHIQGANGAGKTTLFKLIAGLHRPCQGDILYQSQVIHQNLTHYQQQVCFIGHKSGINPYLSMRENCFFDVHFHEDVDLEPLFAVFNLKKYKDIACGLLSAGQKRQVALLRLWYSKASLWLLDEPFVALDAAAIAVLMRRIALHRAAGGMVLLTSHQAIPLDKSCYTSYVL